MKLIVGLGNPGQKYQHTRHNIGFMFIDYIVNKYKLKYKLKYNGEYTEIIFNNEKVILLKPQKYMNLSGEVVKKYIDYFKINLDDILIIVDDLNLELGNIKVKYKGSSGGHNGLQNIQENIGTDNYKRFRIGISFPGNTNMVNYVIENFSISQINKIKKIISQAPIIVDDFTKLSFDNFMNKYNKRESLDE